MDYQVIYFSKSSLKNTKRIADVMAEALGITAVPVSPELTIERSKLLFIGSGVYIGRIGKALREFMDNLPQIEGQKVAIFITHGGGPVGATTEIREKLEEKGCVIIDTWNCLGQWAVFKRGHPTEQEVQNARTFALEAVKKAENLDSVEKEGLETAEEQ
jgi:flavodoxin